VVFGGVVVKVAETKVYRGNKTAVPSAVMEALSLKVGDTVEWHIEDEKVVVKKSLS
jgi:bifunctional DNA-binding transcriptional regulator/antitoxin component of YhaV-PrlF toxin-antitoxin module